MFDSPQTECLKELSKMYNDLFLEQDPKRLEHRVSMFLEKYDIRPELQEVLTKIDGIGKEDKAKLWPIEKVVARDVEKEYVELQTLCKKEGIELHEKCIVSPEQEQRFACFEIIKLRVKAIMHIREVLKFEWSDAVLEKFPHRFSKSKISEPPFLPSYYKWKKRKDEFKKSVWYSVDQLRSLGRTKSWFDPEGPFIDDKEILTCRQMRAIGLSEKQKNVDEYKPLAKILYDYTKEYLLNRTEETIKPAEFTYRYEDIDGKRCGRVSYGDKTLRLEGNSAEFLCLVVKVGREFYWDELGGVFKEKKTVNHARRTVNDGFKTFMLQKQVVPSSKGYLRIGDSISIKLIE